MDSEKGHCIKNTLISNGFRGGGAGRAAAQGANFGGGRFFKVENFKKLK